jgi:hypothetical protein
MPFRCHNPEKRLNKYTNMTMTNVYFLSSLRRLAIGILSLGAELQVPALGRPEEGTGIGKTYGMRSGAETALMFIEFMGL